MREREREREREGAGACRGVVFGRGITPDLTAPGVTPDLTAAPGVTPDLTAPPYNRINIYISYTIKHISLPPQVKCENRWDGKEFAWGA